MAEFDYFTPTTAHDPLMRQLFVEQERRGITNLELARLSSIHHGVISALRHPRADGRGKRPTLAQARAIARALEFHFPDELDRLHL